MMNNIEKLAIEHSSHTGFREGNLEQVTFTTKQLEAFAKSLQQQSEQHCTYPDCKCPLDAPNDDWCAKGLPQQSEPLSELVKTITKNSVDLSAEDKKLLHDNLFSLYESTVPTPAQQQSEPVARIIADPMLLPAFKAPLLDWKVDLMTLELDTDLFTAPPNTVPLEKYNKLLDALKEISGMNAGARGDSYLMRRVARQAIAKHKAYLTPSQP